MDNKNNTRESTAVKIDRSPKVKLRTVWGELVFCPEFPPKSDPVFTVMARDRAFFETLYESITHEKVELGSEPIPQAYVESFNALRKTVRVDVLAVDKDERSLSLDMQRVYNEKTISYRTSYYAACMLASQNVINMAYDKLKNTAVTFIMSEARGKRPVERVRQYYDLNGELRLYNDLTTIYEVYVPSVIDEKTDGDIYIFAKFFAISTAEEFFRFSREFSDSKLAERLALRYSEVFTMGRFRTLTIDDDDLFRDKSAEEIKEIGRLEGILEGELKGRAEGKAEGELKGKLETSVGIVKNMYKAGADVSTIRKLTGLDTAFIQSVTL